MDRSNVVVTSEKQYTELTAVTWNFQTKELDIDHCLLGISSELGEIESAIKKQVGYRNELDLVNIKEEIGDLLFYIYRLSSIHNIELNWDQAKSYIVKIEDDFSIANLLANNNHIREHCLGTRFEVHSRYVFGMTSFSRRDGLMISLSSIQALMLYFGFDDIYEIMTINIRKLAVRFPDKYDSFLASNRDLETERKILEAGEGE